MNRVIICITLLLTQCLAFCMEGAISVVSEERRSETEQIVRETVERSVASLEETAHSFYWRPRARREDGKNLEVVRKDLREPFYSGVRSLIHEETSMYLEVTSDLEREIYGRLESSTDQEMRKMDSQFTRFFNVGVKSEGALNKKAKKERDELLKALREDYERALVSVHEELCAYLTDSLLVAEVSEVFGDHSPHRISAERVSEAEIGGIVALFERLFKNQELKVEKASVEDLNAVKAWLDPSSVLFGNASDVAGVKEALRDHKRKLESDFEKFLPSEKEEMKRRLDEICRRLG